MIRQASSWAPAEDPRPARLQDLEGSAAIRWVDLYGGDLRDSEALALFDPVCRGQLRPRMIRDLVTPGRYPATRDYDAGRVAITSAFRTRELREEGGAATSVFEPVHLLAGDGWLLSCWLPPRVYRGTGTAWDSEDETSQELYRAVARTWLDSGGETARDLAEAVQGELATTSGYRPAHD